jgi:hypothetical protein
MKGTTNIEQLETQTTDVSPSSGLKLEPSSNEGGPESTKTHLRYRLKLSELGELGYIKWQPTVNPGISR